MAEFYQIYSSDTECLRRAAILSQSRAIVNLVKSYQNVRYNSLNGFMVTFYMGV